MNAIRALVLDPRDNVATAIADIEANTKVFVKVGEETREFLVKQSIPFGHKFALRRIETGGDVIKYGEVIGRATKSIELGEYVHVHNVESARGRAKRGGRNHGVLWL